MHEGRRLSSLYSCAAASSLQTLLRFSAWCTAWDRHSVRRQQKHPGCSWIIAMEFCLCPVGCAVQRMVLT
ncbi:unnamed protein product [Victoria cruziana]